MTALLVGVVFAAGLVLSGMVSPANVLGFLDVGGAWNPALLLVMGGAIAVYAPVAYFVRPRFPPDQQDIDARLVIGAAIFGVGWGLAGYCPGPAIVAVGASLETGLFVLAMIAGIAIAKRLR